MRRNKNKLKTSILTTIVVILGLGVVGMTGKILDNEFGWIQKTQDYFIKPPTEEPTISEELFKFELIREYDLSNYSEEDFVKEEKTMSGIEYFSWKIILDEDEGDYLEINNNEEIFSLHGDLTNRPYKKISLNIGNVKEVNEVNKKYVANISGQTFVNTLQRGQTFVRFETQLFEIEELGLISVYQLLDN